MKIYKTNEIKNIALIGSKGSGKTTLAESMLFECGVIKRRGNIESGNTVSDYFPVEKEYGYSVFSTVFNAEFNGKKLNVIDCPGADDFVGNSYTALGVCDTGVIVIDSEYGVEVGTQNIFRTTGKLKKPIIFALNQIDGEKADYENVIEQLREHFGSKVVAVQYPLESGPGFHSMIDVLLMKKYEWGPDGGVPTISEIPEEEMEKANELHNALVEAAAENDETLMDKYFEQGHLSEDEMREGIRKGLIDRSIFPVFIVSALKDMGVRRMMEFLGNVCPFVSDMPAPETISGEPVAPDANGPLSVFFFKTSVEPHIGEVSYFKVMSGTLKAGDDLENISLFHRVRKIKLHDDFNAVPMEAAHHAAELLAGITARSVGRLRRKIKCLLISPAIQPPGSRRFRILPVIGRKPFIDMVHLILDLCLGIGICAVPFTLLVLVGGHQLDRIDTEFSQIRDLLHQSLKGSLFLYF